MGLEAGWGRSQRQPPQHSVRALFGQSLLFFCCCMCVRIESSKFAWCFAWYLQRVGIMKSFQLARTVFACYCLDNMLAIKSSQLHGITLPSICCVLSDYNYVIVYIDMWYMKKVWCGWWAPERKSTNQLQTYPNMVSFRHQWISTATKGTIGSLFCATRKRPRSDHAWNACRVVCRACLQRVCSVVCTANVLGLLGQM